MTRRIGLLVLLIAVSALLQIMMAQLVLETNMRVMVDDNINNNALQTGDNITSLNAFSGYRWEGEDWTGKVFYDGELNLYRSISARSNQFHSGTAQVVLETGNDGLNIVQVSAGMGWGLFRDEYIFYDHRLFSYDMEYKYFLTDWIINKIGYSFRSTTFTNATGFSAVEHIVYGHAAVALETGTTVIFQSDLGMKYYTEELTTTTRNSGWLKSVNPDVTQVIGTLRIGQRLSDEAGLSGTIRYQWNLQKQSRYLIDNDGYLLSDDEIFDDHYGYEGLHSSLMYTHLLSETAKLRFTAGIVNKVYSLLPALDRDGSILADQRIDQRAYANLLVLQSFVELGFDVSASIDLIANTSNDAYYQYTNKAFTLELSVPF